MARPWGGLSLHPFERSLFIAIRQAFPLFRHVRSLQDIDLALFISSVFFYDVFCIISCGVMIFFITCRGFSTKTMGGDVGFLWFDAFDYTAFPLGCR